LSTVGEDGYDLGKTVTLEVDAGATLEAAIQSFVKETEDVFLPISDKDHRESPCPVQVVQDVFVLELVYFVENNDIVRAIIGTESVKEFVARGGLAVDVDGLVDAIENPVQRFESAVVLPTVDVLVVKLNDVLPELIDGVPGDTGFACA